MAPRTSRVSAAAPATSGKTKKRNKKRALDAFSIATAENPERAKVRPHRYGEIEDDGQRKRRRIQDDDFEQDEGGYGHRNHAQKDKAQHRSEDSVSEGEDSEGNTWTMGHVDADDDSDLDSDEAFGSSDEERFEGFTFRGSSSGKKKTKQPPRSRQFAMNLNEQDGNDTTDSDGEDSLGEDAVDLATMLDQSEEGEESSKRAKRPRHRGQHTRSKTNHEDSESAEDSDASEDEVEGSESEEVSDSEDSGSVSEDELDSHSQHLQLRNLIDSIKPAEPADRTTDIEDRHEQQTPSQYGLGNQQLKIEDLLPTIHDRSQRKALKILKDPKTSSRRGIPARASVPLPKRQQDRINRVAASEKAKETLNKWVDTVKHNRRAEHLSFPLKDPNEGNLPGTKRFNHKSDQAPRNDLESTIQDILQESGLATGDGKTDEEKLQAFEELETKHIPLEEVLARRAELRQARDLLFREERRAKRIKKIKSKTYRRVHRKERERADQKERDAFAAAGFDMSEEEKELADRRRAEERMGAKHRESKWAKGVKRAGRAAWDKDARAGVTEMARRNEELRKRIDGKDVSDDNDSASEDDTHSSDGDGDEEERIQQQLEKTDQGDSTSGRSNLASMGFMKRAEAARKAQNDEDAARLRRELQGQDDGSDDGVGDVGRQIFGPSKKSTAPIQAPRELEETHDSDAGSDSNHDPIILEEKNQPSEPAPATTQSRQKARQPPLQDRRRRMESPEGTANPWLKGKRSRSSLNQQSESSLKPSQVISTLPVESEQPAKKATNTSAPADTNGWTVVTYDHKREDAEESSEQEDLMPFVLRNQELVQKAFAGDDVVADFEKEKQETMVEEDEKMVDNHVPGWGSWTGDGVSKREQRRHKGKNMTKQEGIKPSNRKDARLNRVIINEKRVKKNVKYMASQLPHPFETRQQYERSLRLPVGPEWTTKETFQSATKPRVMVKQVIIKPMSKPLI